DRGSSDPRRVRARRRVSRRARILQVPRSSPPGCHQPARRVGPRDRSARGRRLRLPCLAGGSGGSGRRESDRTAAASRRRSIPWRLSVRGLGRWTWDDLVELPAVEERNHLNTAGQGWPSDTRLSDICRRNVLPWVSRVTSLLRKTLAEDGCTGVHLVLFLMRCLRRADVLAARPCRPVALPTLLNCQGNDRCVRSARCPGTSILRSSAITFSRWE